MSIERVYDYINENYGLRGIFIAELARNLGTSYEHARILTVRAGYKRTKKVSTVTLAEFSKDLSVQYIISKI